MKEPYETLAHVGLLAIGCFMLSCTITLFSVGPERDRMKREAIERGYAEWVVDPKTWQTTWKWKDTK